MGKLLLLGAFAVSLLMLGFAAANAGAPTAPAQMLVNGYMVDVSYD